MSQKQKLKEILAKLKSWSESAGDEALDQYLTELENEINASTTSDEDDEGGNSPDTPPDLP